MMDEKGRALSETVWTRLDRKAGAITEFTVRQLRHRISTWVVPVSYTHLTLPTTPYV